MVQRTLAIVKPDGVANKVAGQVIARIEKEGFRIVAMRLHTLSRSEAEGFYAVHKARPFFSDLVAFMTSGPCLPMALERADPVATLRQVIGATDPAEAAPGTVRKLFGESKQMNSVHASDSPASSEREVKYFFGAVALVPEGRRSASIPSG